MSAFTPEERRLYIGGSDAGAVIGVSQYRTPYDVWAEKVGEIEPADLSDKEAVQWGNILEDVIAQEYARRSGDKVRRVNKMMTHPEHPFLAAHVDRKIEGKNEGLEVKTAGFFLGKEYGEEGSDELPAHYIAQTMHYMAVTGWDCMHIAALIGGQRLWIGRVERDEKLIQQIIQAEVEFWRRVVDRKPPPPSNQDDCKNLFPSSNGESIIATDQALQAMDRLREIRESMKELEKEEQTLKMRIMAELGEAEILSSSSGEKLATWKSTTSNRLDTKKLKADHPKLAAEYSRQSTYRVMRIK